MIAPRRAETASATRAEAASTSSCSRYPNHDPAERGESRICIGVAFLVGQQLWLPVGGVSPRLGTVYRARVPEASIDEDGNLRCREDEIGCSSDHERGRERPCERKTQGVTARRSASSGFVLRLRFPSMILRRPGEEAHDARGPVRLSSEP